MNAHESEFVDPLHRQSGPNTAWTRVNIGEGIPGVCTPLNWSWRDDSQERTIRGAYYDMGVLPRIEIPHPNEASLRTSSIFYGRPALNVDVSRGWADMQPGTSGDALEQGYFGAVRPEVQSVKSRRRYPVILFKSLPLWARVHRRVDALYSETRTLWRYGLSADVPEDLASARAGFRAAHRQFETVTRPHSVLALLVGALTQQLAKLAADAGHPDAMLDLLGGHESIELATAADMREVGVGRLPLAEFLRRHGYQGPGPGEISRRMWREDPAPVEGLARALAKGAVPKGAGESAARRQAAERKILSGLSGPRRSLAGLLTRRAKEMIPARETGKASMMMSIDLGRYHARVLGRLLADAGQLHDPEDVFYLTLPELLSDAEGSALGERVSARRAQRAYYQSLELPESWVGMVAPIAEVLPSERPRVLKGLGVSPGRVRGRVRVLDDASQGELLEPGEILVCVATDPAWASCFLVAGGVVTDIGGALGHGAIVAREVGIPCVVNTKTGSRQLRSGDEVEVDGSTGRVEVLHPV